LKNNSPSELGKIQPQAVELEEAVLGAIMLEPAALALALVSIQSETIFYKTNHQVIFKAILGLYAENKPVDIMTVTERLKINGDLELAGGGYGVTQLTNRVASSANIEYHIAIIKQKWLRREMIRLSSTLIKQSFEDDEDVFDAIDSHMLGLMGLYNTINITSAEQVGTIAQRNAVIIKNTNQSDFIGLASGYRLIDAVTNGFQNGDLIIVAGRPGMGKTAFGISMIYHMAVTSGIPVGFISLEMTKFQVVLRLQSIMINLPYQDLRSGALSESQQVLLDADVQKLLKTRAFVDDTPSLTIIQLRAKAIDMVRSHQVKMIMVDYLQLMSGVKKGQNREQEVSEISRGLKALAKELDIPIIAFSQLSRKVEDRGNDKKPILSDLRESGAIEQDADMVIFLYRPEYYGKTQDEQGNTYENVGIALIEKHRNGSTGEFRLTFDKRTMFYKNYNWDDGVVVQKQTPPYKQFKDEDDEMPF
jgi:replicative DNA helicase